jgi:predicted O-methyltransferase YrrM
MKLGLLFRVLRRNPSEFLARLLTIAEFQADRMRAPATLMATAPETLVRQLSESLGIEISRFLQEGALREIEGQVIEAQKRLLNPAFEQFHNARIELARLCYAVCRARQPEVVVETGVGYGITSAFFLQGLAVNGKGKLWSIDLPPLGENADSQCGILVPEDLRPRWHLVRGRTRRMLPEVIAGLTMIDIFLHDSLHTFRNMSFEFQAVWPRLRGGGVLFSDDVMMSRAFEKLIANPSISYAAVDGAAFFGVAVKELQFEYADRLEGA